MSPQPQSPQPPQNQNPSPSPNPEPPQSPSPSPGETSRRKRTEGSSPGSSGAAGKAFRFVSDPGPAFDPKLAPEAPGLEDPAAAELEALEGWREDTVRSLLVTQGNVTHALLKVGPEDTETWKQTEEDLNAIAPPMTRLLNRYDVTRAAAAAGDEIALGAALAAYGARNYTRRRRLLAAIAAQGPEPITGVPADEGVGPEYDEQYQRLHEAPPAIRPKGVR